MARFILDYDTTLNDVTKSLISEICNPSMVCPNELSAQYSLIDLLVLLDSCLGTNSELSTDGLVFDNSDLQEDYDYLYSLSRESVNYIEICF